MAAANVVIVGGGPAGLLLAHYLLQRGDAYTAELHEARPDLRTESIAARNRQYAIGLSERGRNAIQGVEGLWPLVQKEGAEISRFVLHFGKREQNLKRRADKPSLLINRSQLAATLLAELERRHGPKRLKLHFNSRCLGADFAARTASFSASEKCPYDLLVGADGVRSAVRLEFLKRREFDYQQRSVDNAWKVLHVPRPPGIAVDAVHNYRFQRPGQSGGGPFGLFAKRDPTQGDVFALAIPTNDGGLSVLISWDPKKPPRDFLAIERTDEMSAFLERLIPGITVSPEAAEDFLKQRASGYMQVRCSRYHDSAGRAILIGDAAHANSSALGQGANSSLQDVVALDRILSESRDDIDAALPRYSELMVPEGQALAELTDNFFPRSRALAAVSIARQLALTQISNWFPNRVYPPIQSLTSETLMPYSEIARINRRWLNTVRMSNEKLKMEGLQ
ncbi:kynurenine 3-monooxygenase [Klebsormidium nitens]|uniref:Kynurenine 3-monooxygenase n=1 Tax=Klebsormidium nitens TaxID=105231 RepID=A0A1Y1I349_KLENI|nr:kynurenine 3-monooxygenase [Klebsormidium nitens]|eukprot:GAQ85360.1 kynurenine 3-monooxygenase [Klebsormidium nitens]